LTAGAGSRPRLGLRIPRGEMIEAQPNVALRTDPPRAIRAFSVGLEVTAIALDTQWSAGKRRLDIVEHRPDPLSLCVVDECDLGHMSVMGRDTVTQHGFEIGKVLLVGHASLWRLLGHVVHAVFGEQLRKSVPVLRVEQPKVARLELLYLFDVPQLRCRCCHPRSHSCLICGVRTNSRRSAATS